MKINKSIKYLYAFFILSTASCTSNTTDISQISKTSSVYDLNLGPKGGGTIDPKITVGQTIINFKQGDGVLLFNLNLAGKGFTTKDTITVTPSITPNPTVTPSPTPSSDTNSISKIANEIYINEKKYLLDISSDKLSNNKHILNLTGLKKGDIVSLSSQVYDSKSQVIGKESVQNKEVKSDIESFDLNISLNINISQEQKTEVNVTQSQVVLGPTINITIPTPQNNNQNNQGQQPPPPPINQQQPNNNDSCIKISQDNSLTTPNGSVIKVCSQNDNSQVCYKKDPSGNIRLNDGKIIKVCN